MDPKEIVDGLTRIGQVAAATVPFTAIVKRMLGPAADELAEMWRDRVRMYRYERQLKCVEKADGTRSWVFAKGRSAEDPISPARRGFYGGR